MFIDDTEFEPIFNEIAKAEDKATLISLLINKLSEEKKVRTSLDCNILTSYIIDSLDLSNKGNMVKELYTIVSKIRTEYCDALRNLIKNIFSKNKINESLKSKVRSELLAICLAYNASLQKNEDNIDSGDSEEDFLEELCARNIISDKKNT